MNNDQFAYWLQGFVEMNGGKEPTKEQWKMIKDHLQLCFKKMTPPLMPYGVGGTFGGDIRVKHVSVGHPGGGGPASEVDNAGGGRPPLEGNGGSNFYGSFGAGAPFENGRYLTNAEIAQRKAKGGER